MYKPSNNVTPPVNHDALQQETSIIKWGVPAPEKSNNWALLTPDSIKLLTSRQYLSQQSASRLAQTCHFFNKLITPTLKLERLSHSILVLPNEDEVITRLNAEPELANLRNLLTTKIGQVVDRAGRTIINKTLFQLAYGAGDDVMCLVLKPFFIKAYGNEETAIHEMKRQRDDMFEIETTAESEKESQDYLNKLLQDIISAINTEKFETGRINYKKIILQADTMKAIEIFREAFDITQPKIIDKGMHFDYGKLLEIYRAYEKIGNRRWHYSQGKCMLFQDAVLSHILSYVPENDAEKFSQGLYFLQGGRHLDDEREPFKRCRTLRDKDIHFFNSLRSESDRFVLLGNCVDISEGTPWEYKMSGAGRADLIIILYQDFYEKKMSNLQSLFTQPSCEKNLSV